MDQCVIALDLGTTGNRSIAFDKKGKIIFNFYYEFPQIFPAPAWVEQDPFDILNTALKSLHKTISFCKSKNYDILSIGITNQRETSILWNKKTGKPVYNAIVWQCRRTENICENLKNYSELIKEKTGLFLDPYFSATKIKWIIDNVAGVKESILKDEILFGTVDSWILWNLTEEKNHFTDTSNASRTLLYNINTLKYDNELLNIFKIPENILPEVKSSSSIFGFLNPKYLKGNFTKRIPIIGILGDQQASLFAHASFDGGIVKNTYGTGLFVMAQSGKQPFKSDKLVSTIAWTIKNETYYAVEGSIFTGGALINWLKDGLKIIKSYSETDKSAKKLNSNEGVYFVPALSGLGAPYWNSSARGMIIGITGKTTKENIIRAALESLAYSTKDVVNELFNMPYKLRVDGKASENNFLMQFQSDILGIPVERTNISEMTAFGIAGFSGIYSGLWSIEEYLKLYKIKKVFTPKMSENERKLHYDKWKQAVSKTLYWSN